MKRGPKPKKIINTKWSPDLAYAVGLLTTDGCLSKDGRHIDMTSKDIEQIDNFIKCLKLKTKIGKKNKGQNNFAYRIQVSSVLFYDFLLSIGLSKRKSLILSKVDVPDKYFFDFLRGVFDGDGSTYSYWDKRWKSSFMFYFCIASGSLKFIEWLQMQITRLIGAKGHYTKVKKINYCYQLRYSKYEAIKVIKKIYSDTKSTRLNRKHLKIVKTLAIVGEKLD